MNHHLTNFPRRPGELPMLHGPNIPVLKRVGETQRLWQVKQLAAHFFDNGDKATTKMLSNWQHISDAHKLLWPQLPCPEPIRLADDELPERIRFTQPVVFHTTVVFAVGLSMFTMTSRSQAARAKAATFLKALVEKACSSGCSLNVPIVDTGAKYRLCKQDVTSPTGVSLFSDNMLKEVDSYWKADMGSGKKPWLTTTASHANLAEILLWCLDPVPVKGSRGGYKKLREWKGHLRLAALGILTQLANLFCDPVKIQTLTEPISKRRKQEATNTRRTNRATLWPLLGQALHFMVDGTVTCTALTFQAYPM